MKIHHLRNATLVLEAGEHYILVDPMLGKKGKAAPPFTLFRFKPKRNPLVDLPDNSKEILERVTHCLITHLHPDHLDKAAIEFLREKKIPITCSFKDRKKLKHQKLNVVQEVEYLEKVNFLDGHIMGVPARHGYGFIAGPMGNVMGFMIQLPNEPSVYISADTIYTEDVNELLKGQKPDISILACGSAQLDIGKPLLMHMKDILRFVENAPGKVLANHMEALNHCPTSREELRVALSENGFQEKVAVPEDGEVVSY